MHSTRLSTRNKESPFRKDAPVLTSEKSKTFARCLNDNNGHLCQPAALTSKFRVRIEDVAVYIRRIYAVERGMYPLIPVWFGIGETENLYFVSLVFFFLCVDHPVRSRSLPLPDCRKRGFPRRLVPDVASWEWLVRVICKYSSQTRFASSQK